MAKKRIYELATEIGKSSNELLELLKKNNIKKTNFSAVDDKDMEIFARAYARKPEAPPKKELPKKEPPKPAMPRPAAGAVREPVKRPVQNVPRGREQENRYGGRESDRRPGNAGLQNRGVYQQNQGGRSQGNARPQGGMQRPGQAGYSHGGVSQGAGNASRRPQQNNQRPQQRQGGIFIGPRGQQPGQHRTVGTGGGQQSHAERPQQGAGRAQNAPRRNPAGGGGGRMQQPQRGDKRPQQGGRQENNRNRREKPQLKGSYATKESRPNRSQGHQMNRGNANKRQNLQPKVQVEIKRPVYVEMDESINVKDFAALIKREVNEVIKALFMLGVMVTINQDIDYDTALLIGEEFGVEVALKEPDRDPTEIPEVEDDPAQRLPRPPVVTVMGHVDHGKTSLLDAIRKTNVTAREAGGITQHIGAYKVSYQGRQIVFLDTPGHEAFTAMRARGAQVTDIAVLVVAADDGVMPQTLEAINHAKAAKVPIIVAINKMDRPGANPEHVKQQLSEQELIPEDWGGETIMVPVSAYQKTGITDLLEMILLVAEVQDLKANPNLPAHGTIIEAQLDKGRGPVATVLVQRGTLQVGDNIIAGTTYGKVRAMINDCGEKIKKALPSTPVEVLGLNDVPAAGDIIDATDEKTARSVAEKRLAKKREELQTGTKVSLEDLFQRIREGSLKELNIVVKADVQGTIEALKSSLQKIKNDEVKVNVVHAGVGSITESDVMLASSANALIIGFNVRPDANARKSAEAEKVDLRTYRVIYDAINDVEAAIKGMLAPKFKESIQGRVEVRQVISISKMLIAGCYVLEGKVTNSSKVRVVRDGIVINEGGIDSLRRFKDDVKEVQQGFECGITLDKFRDIKEGDIFEVFVMEEMREE